MMLEIKLVSREVERAFRRAGKEKGIAKAGIRAANAAGKVLRGSIAGILQSIANAPKVTFQNPRPGGPRIAKKSRISHHSESPNSDLASEGGRQTA